MGSNIRIAAESETLVEAKVVMRDGRPVLENVKVHPPRRPDDSGNGDNTGDGGNNGGDSSHTGTIVSRLYLDLFGLGEIADALELFLKGPDDKRYSGDLQGESAVWDDVPAGEYLLMANLKEGGSSGGASSDDGFPVTLGAGRQGGGAVLRMVSGKPAVASGQIGPAVPTPAVGSRSAETSPLRIFPTMIVDYYMGEETRLTLESDPRFLLDKDKLRDAGENLSSNTRWSLGDRGWIILGFDEGFLPDRDYTVRFRETGGMTEWIRIWAAQHIDGENPLTYERGANRYFGPDGLVYPNNPSDPAKRRITRQQAEDVEYRPPWLGENWKYVGAVRGDGEQEGGRVDGPHLGDIPFGHYKYILLYDAGDAALQADHPDWDGADIMEAGIYARARLLTETTYHLLVIDLSRSAAGVESDYQKAVKIFIRALVKKPGKHKLGVRFFKGVVSETSTGTWRHNFGTDESPQWWLDIENGNPDYQGVVDQVLPHMIFGAATPLLNALKAAAQLDLRTTGEANPSQEDWKEPIPDAIPPGTFVEIVLITDGLPDPGGNLPATVADYGPTHRDATLARIKDEIIPALKALAAKARGYQPEIIGAFNTDFSNPADTPERRFLNSIYKTYNDYSGDLTAEGEQGFLARVTDLRDADHPPVVEVVPISHTDIPHTDCVNGSRAGSRRIGENERKRLMRGATSAGGDLRRLRTPLTWPGDGRENITGPTHAPEYTGTNEARRAAEHDLPADNLEPDAP